MRLDSQAASDIAFSESAFLTKTRSSYSESDGAVEDSDDSEAHSDHSRKERSNRRRSRLAPTSPTNTPLEDVQIDKVQRIVPLPIGSTREESPPWDVETHLACASDANSFTSTSAGKLQPTVLKVNQCSWAPKLQKPTLDVTYDQDSPLIPTPVIPVEGEQRITSSYFHSTEPDTRLSVTFSPLPESEHHHSTAADGVWYPADSRGASLNELDFIGDPVREVASSFHEQGLECMRTSQPSLLGYDSPICSQNQATYRLPHQDNLAETDDTLHEWQPQEPEYSGHQYHALKTTDLPDSDAEVLVYDGSTSDDVAVLGEPYDSYEPRKAVYHEVDDCYGYPNGDCYQFLGEANVQHGSSEAVNFGDGWQVASETDNPSGELDIRNDYMSWGTNMHNNRLGESFGYPPAELELDDAASFRNHVAAHGHELEAPRLVHIITDTSLDEDLLRCIGNHWNTTRRRC
ncbi:hypothetical protein RhiJN_19100 [Ceratobasidium sp. AG-Ba]|nr:hypothetical protein RhiJN_04278 [Ceratobasidium sp. AG-Ba]QRV91082.1 hypothetical protein RhiJN_19100 [Ceratobasidium sp. AG-Ba]